MATAAYDAANRIITWGGIAYSYDANGNLSSDGMVSYMWNVRNELTGLSGAQTAAMTYDGFGRRRTKTVDGSAVTSLYDGVNPVQEMADGLPTFTLVSAGIDEVLQRTDGTTMSGILTDGLGSTFAVTDAAGSIGTNYTYAPFGASVASGLPSLNRTQFTGRDDDGTGLLFYRARYLDATAGRFVSEDPSGFDGGINLYAYVQNNPTNFTDPFGLAECVYQVQAHVLVCRSNRQGSGGTPLQLGPEGVSSGSNKGNQQCRDNPDCTDVKDLGPITPGKYKMNADTRPEHAGWDLFRLEPWPHHFYDGMLYRLGLTRGGFELHLGSITYGCINADKSNSKAVDQYRQLLRLLQSEDGNNFLTVIP